jgi:hypothetical protein
MAGDCVDNGVIAFTVNSHSAAVYVRNGTGKIGRDLE